MQLLNCIIYVSLFLAFEITFLSLRFFDIALVLGLVIASKNLMVQVGPKLKLDSWLAILVFITIYLKTIIWTLYIAPTVVPLRYLEILLSAFILTNIIANMTIRNLRNSTLVVAALNAIWIFVQVATGLKFGLYGFSSIGYFGAAFSSSTVVSAIVILLTLFLFAKENLSWKLLNITILGINSYGLLAVGSRTAAIATLIIIVLLLLVGVSNTLTKKRALAFLTLVPALIVGIYLIYTFGLISGTLDDNSIFDRMTRINSAVYERYLDKPMPTDMVDAIIGSPETRDFVGHKGVGFTIDSMWMGMLRNFGLGLTIPLTILYIIFVLKNSFFLVAIYTFAIASGIDILSTLHPFLMVVIIHLVYFRLREKSI